MKNKLKVSHVLLATLMLFTLAACGPKGPDMPNNTPDGGGTAAQLKSPKTVTANLWELVYDEQDGWVYEDDEMYDDETYSSISLRIPKEDEEQSIVVAEIYVWIEGPGDFRDYLTSFGFDEYEYAVNQAYDLTELGGIECLEAEGSDWGSPCLRYLSRVEGAGATVLVEITGEYQDERVEKLLSGLTINLEDTGNEDGPWYWEGEPFSVQPHSAVVGTYTIDSQWLPITDCIVTKETFEHAAAVTGNQAFLLVDGELKCYDYDGTSLKFAEDIGLDTDYERIFADTTGTIWLSNFMEPLIGWKDGAQAASYEGLDYVAMHPSGTWGISWFSAAECEKITLSGGAITTEPIMFQEVDLISTLLVDDNHIYVCGFAADGGDHKVFVYDTAGNLQVTLAASNGGSLGSVTFVTETANGYLALDGNMRKVVLWSKDGTYIGQAEDSALFGTSYPWFCGGTKLADGSVMVIMTEERADESAQELVAFKLSGF